MGDINIDLYELKSDIMRSVFTTVVLVSLLLINELLSA